MTHAQALRDAICRVFPLLPMTTPHRYLSTDPVATSIEEYLQRQSTLGHGPLKLREHPDEVTVSFGPVATRGEDYDIALLRLARVLMDDERFRDGLIDLLRARAHG